MGFVSKSLRYSMHRKGATANIVLRVVFRDSALCLKSNLTNEVHLDDAALNICAVALIYSLSCSMSRHVHFQVLRDR